MMNEEPCDKVEREPSYDWERKELVMSLAQAHVRGHGIPRSSFADWAKMVTDSADAILRRIDLDPDFEVKR